MSMTYSQGAIALVEQFEGLDLSAYPDPATHGAPWTCGRGHTGKDVKPGMVVHLSQADAWMHADLAIAAAAVNAHVTVALNQNQFDALCDFVFNEGAGNFASSTMLRLLNGGKYADAANQLTRWNQAAGHVMAGLTRRRNAEKTLFNRPVSKPL